jgi:hypothetical protein
MAHSNQRELQQTCSSTHLELEVRNHASELVGRVIIWASALGASVKPDVEAQAQAPLLEVADSRLQKLPDDLGSVPALLFEFPQGLEILSCPPPIPTCKQFVELFAGDYSADGPGPAVDCAARASPPAARHWPP